MISKATEKLARQIQNYWIAPEAFPLDNLAQDEIDKIKSAEHKYLVMLWDNNLDKTVKNRKCNTYVQKIARQIKFYRLIKNHRLKSIVRKIAQLLNPNKQVDKALPSGYILHI